MNEHAHRRAAGRPRASEAGLTRERVLAEALVLLDREGLRTLTMRRLADHLGVTPMALYNHVSDKADLLLGVAETLFASADFSSAHPDWRDQLRACFREMRRVCRAHPEVLRLIEVVEAPVAAVFTPLAITLTALSGLALDDDDALRAYFLLVNFTLGQVTYEVRGPYTGVDLRAAQRWPEAIATRLPDVADAAPQPDWDFDAAFEFGLTTIIAGLETSRREAGSARRAPTTSG